MHITSKRYIFSCTSFAVGAALFFSLAPTASADVNGSFGIANCGGSGIVGGVEVSSSSITWLPIGSLAGTGCMDVNSNLTSSGGPVVGGFVGDIENLSFGVPPAGAFMTFHGLNFVLGGFTPPPTLNTSCGTTVSGQSCIVSAGSPFFLTNESNGFVGDQTSIVLSAFGTITDGGHTGTWTGLFTTQLLESPGAIQTTINGGGTIQSSYSASFKVVTPVPEPVSLGMIGAGLIAFAFAGKKRRVRS